MGTFLSGFKNKKLKKSFTLIELLVVMAVLSLLAGAVIFSTDNARDKGKDSKRKQDLNTIATALTGFYADNGYFPPEDQANTILDYSSFGGDDNWIPDLDEYIPEMPNDPLIANAAATATQTATNQISAFTNKIAGLFKPKNEPKPEPQVAATGTKTYSIATGDDDVQGGHGSGFSFSKTGTNLQITKTTGYVYYKPGLRFTNIDLPSNTTITAARLKFTPKNDTPQEQSLNTTSGLKVKITTDITNTPSTQVADYNDFFAKWDHNDQPPSQWKSIASVPAWYNGGAPIDPAATTFDVTELVRAEINRSVWQTNYPIHFFLMPDDESGSTPGSGRMFYSYNYANNSTLAAKLEIDYDTTPPPAPQIIACEAEAGAKVAGSAGQFSNGSDGAATGGVYITSSADDNESGGETNGPTGGSPGNGLGGTSTLTIYPNTGGTYYVWARVNYPTSPESLGENNSFWMQINGRGPDGTANTFFRVGNDNGSGWHWVNYRNGTSSDLIVTTLNANVANTIKIWSREDHTYIDKLELVSSSSYAVGGLGDAINCPTAAPTKTATITGRESGTSNPFLPSITVDNGDTVDIQWSSTSTSSCTITSNPSGSFSGSGTSGSGTTSALTGPTTIIYNISCDAGAAQSSLTVNVGATSGGGAKSATITANGSTTDITVENGETVTIGWTTSNVATCIINPGPLATMPTPDPIASGDKTTGALTANQTYTIICDSGDVQDSINVTVNPPAGGGGPPGGGATRSACDNANVQYCYRVSLDRKSYIIWAQLENLNDPDIYNGANNTAACNDDDPEVVPPSGSGLNYCVKSPNLSLD